VQRANTQGPDSRVSVETGHCLSHGQSQQNCEFCLHMARFLYLSELYGWKKSLCMYMYGLNTKFPLYWYIYIGMILVYTYYDYRYWFDSNHEPDSGIGISGRELPYQYVKSNPATAWHHR
jgi:hypothetical protein